MTDIQRERVRGIRRRASTPYDSSDEEHKHELYSFGVAVFGEGFTPKHLKSDRWKSIGFQGPNPATDFRGAGLFGLQNLHYLVHIEPRIVRRMTRSEHMSPEHYLPFAITGLNMTFMLLQTLNLNSPWTAKLSPEEADVYMGFCNLVGTEEFAFEEIYKSSLDLLDELWTESRAKYLEFPYLLARVRTRVCDTLICRPSTISDFNRIFSEEDDDDDVTTEGGGGVSGGGSGVGLGQREVADVDVDIEDHYIQDSLAQTKFTRPSPSPPYTSSLSSSSSSSSKVPSFTRSQRVPTVRGRDIDLP